MNNLKSPGSDIPTNIHVFNHLPNRYLHQTWWKSIKHGNALEILGSHRRTEQRVASIILRYFKLTNCYHDEFNSFLEKSVLLPATDLCLLIDHLGLCFSNQNISHSMMKPAELEYKQEFGDYYLFADSTAKNLRDSLGIKESYRIHSGHLYIQNHIIGLHVLGKAFTDSGMALKQRLILKLGTHSKQYISEKSDLKPLRTPQSSCISLIEAVSAHLKLEIDLP
jgi:hypothetical protein